MRCVPTGKDTLLSQGSFPEDINIKNFQGTCFFVRNLIEKIVDNLI